MIKTIDGFYETEKLNITGTGMEKTEKDWRKKAIEYLEKSNDKDVRKAITVLKDGKGYLTCYAPIMIKFFDEL